jgi:hypothetical protein
MDKCSNIEVKKLTEVNGLTLDAEMGHGHDIRSALDRLPFEEQLHLAHQIAIHSQRDSKAYDCPKIEFVTEDGRSDDGSPNGYTNLKLYRRTSGPLGPLSDKEDLLYESSLNLTTGNKTASDNDW